MGFDERVEQRFAELEFHIRLAQRCNSPMLSFMGRFLNDMIRDLVIFKKSSLPEQREFSCANLHYHEELMLAFRAKDAEHKAQYKHTDHLRPKLTHIVSIR